jgi:hypothetical protein
VDETEVQRGETQLTGSSLGNACGCILVGLFLLPFAFYAYAWLWSYSYSKQKINAALEQKYGTSLKSVG